MDIDRAIGRAGRATLVAMTVTLVAVACAAITADDGGGDAIRVAVWPVERERATVTASVAPDARPATGAAQARVVLTRPDAQRR